MKFFTHTLILSALFLVNACSENSSPETEAQNEKPTDQIRTEQPAHSAEEIRGETITLAGVTLVVQSKGALEPGNQYQLSIGVIEGERGAIIRTWIGDESRVGSLVYKAHSHGDHYHGSAEVPDIINSQTALWLEVQSVTGETESGSVALK